MSSPSDTARYDEIAACDVCAAEIALPERNGRPVERVTRGEAFQLYACVEAVTGELVGVVRLDINDADDHARGNRPEPILVDVELSVAILPAAQRRGHALRALRLMVAALRTEALVLAARVRVRPDNAAAQALVKRLDFAPAGKRSSFDQEYDGFRSR